MLATQVQYWGIQETKRHNLVSERQTDKQLAEQQRHNTETEHVQWFNARESQRHNQEAETISWFTARESQRHNKQQEAISWFGARENQRHNLVTEKETQRHNYATEFETSRHNKQQESIGWFSASETRRHNLSTEAITRQNNEYMQGMSLLNFIEGQRHNRTTEQNQATKNLMDYQINTERNRIEGEKVKNQAWYWQQQLDYQQEKLDREMQFSYDKLTWDSILSGAKTVGDVGTKIFGILK